MASGTRYTAQPLLKQHGYDPASTSDGIVGRCLNSPTAVPLYALPFRTPYGALQVNMQGGYQAYGGAWVPAEQAFNDSLYVPYSYSMPAEEPQRHGGKFQQWQAPGGRPRDTIKAHEGARGEGCT